MCQARAKMVREELDHCLAICAQRVDRYLAATAFDPNRCLVEDDARPSTGLEQHRVNSAPPLAQLRIKRE